MFCWAHRGCSSGRRTRAGHKQLSANNGCSLPVIACRNTALVLPAGVLIPQMYIRESPATNTHLGTLMFHVWSRILQRWSDATDSIYCRCARLILLVHEHHSQTTRLETTSSSRRGATGAPIRAPQCVHHTNVLSHIVLDRFVPGHTFLAHGEQTLLIGTLDNANQQQNVPHHLCTLCYQSY